VVSRRSWDRLPADLKKALDDIAAPFTVRGWEAGQINDKTGIELAKAKGMTVVDVKDEWRQQLTKTGKDVVAAKWAKRVGDKVTKEFNDILGPIAGFTV